MRQCSHDTRVREPLALSDVESLLKTAARAAVQVNTPLVPVWDKVKTPLLALRLAAEIAVAFLAVRRNSEVVALRLGDIFLPVSRLMNVIPPCMLDIGPIAPRPRGSAD